MRIGRLVVRLVALAVLVLGIVVMHHVARPEHDVSRSSGSSAMAAVPEAVDHPMGGDVPAAAASGVADGDGESAGHDLLHLCLAVMTAVAVVLVGWLLLARRPWMWMSVVVAFRALPMPSRAPPRPHGSALLMSLCVMRT